MMEVGIRKWEKQDRFTLQHLADNPKIWDNVRDFFPKPYRLEDADEFIASALKELPVHRMAITCDNELAGGISLKAQPVNYEHSAEIGYWVGEPYWGKKVATEAVRLMTLYGFGELNYKRIFASVFSFNKASMKILENCGYRLEGIGKKAAVKNNQFIDEYRYACLPEYLI
jgi:RimJ/RimL family protein N-acetyltransferase